MSYKVAVASTDGNIIDLHFGHADRFHIYSVSEQGNSLIELRSVKKYCAGQTECSEDKMDTLKAVSDCDAIISKVIGLSPKKKLEEIGVKVFSMVDTVDSGLKNVYSVLSQD
ncbi:MAG TPA: NifB/NifX family molybdenum-iron cluster-binding protein [Spirochaetota bacterium]|nr:NifB/NifX family molybdenum-iron cluster-binding protein [Spirochaetota bacterium]HOR43222.1 NifB/NifX family molybdenum-iron cluster-binding protein [Spirochaetota bacterium]HPK55551.1 NifB/NifX family molybdenum-iron cluster-binding protein [Spirochaetota bacterium]